MKIAVPTQDKTTIFKRTGRAPLFLIFEYKEDCWTKAGSVKNKHHETEDHDESTPHSHDDLVQQIDDCDAILLLNVGKHLKHDLDKANIKIIKAKTDNIEEALAGLNQDSGF